MQSVVSFLASLSLVYYFLFPQHALAQAYDPSQKMIFVRDPALIEQFAGSVAGRSWRVITAYSSTSWQTDSTPFITASGTRVHNGTLAANFLSFGTKVRIPDLFGDKIFTVEDRMNDRFPNRLDVWLPRTWQAADFGVKIAEIEVLE